MVVTERPETSVNRVWQENARLPSICTMQAPHSPVPQPNLVPVSLSSSRITQRSGVYGGASDVAALLLTVKLTVIESPPRCRAKGGAILVYRLAAVAPGARENASS